MFFQNSTHQNYDLTSFLKLPKLILEKRFSLIEKMISNTYMNNVRLPRETIIPVLGLRRVPVKEIFCLLIFHSAKLIHFHEFFFVFFAYQ